MVGGASNRTTPSRRHEECRLVGAVGDPEQVALDAADEVPLLVEGRAERRIGYGCEIGQL